MCGIAGMLDSGWAASASDLGDLASSLADPLAHRGPDGAGTWCDPAVGVGLSQRRLAVVDISDAGAQPMVSTDRRWVLVYNGECYNADDLRAELGARGVRFRGHCDTEVVLEAVAAWGVERALTRCNGMFALALWDRLDRVLYLARDRIGEKPLYYAVFGQTLVFGSELRSIAAHPGFHRDIDPHALGLLLRLNYIPAPLTIYSGARKLAAGSLLRVPAGRPRWPEPQQWWDFQAAAGLTAANVRPDTTDLALDHLDALLRDAVSRRLVADVPLGAFLSGGIDSGLVTALAQDQSPAPVRTFTVAFGGNGIDEAGRARAVARHLGTDHTQIDLTAADALAAVPELARCWDEPLADPSQLPTYLLARHARRHVTVALTGDGGDEGFGGYNRYRFGAAVSRWALPLPEPLRRAAGSAVGAIRPSTWDRMGRFAALARPGRVTPDLGTKAHKLARALAASSTSELYASLVSSWDGAEGLLLDGAAAGGEAVSGWPGPVLLAGDYGPAESMMAWDTLSTLPDELLAKVDRATMAVGLEARAPLLDHRVIEAAWGLPPGLRIAGGQGKVALRRLLGRYVPPSLFDQPKMGFDPPLATWLRGPLRGWAEDLLSPSRLRREGLLHPQAVRTCWDEHLSGRANWDYALWAVLVFESWLEASG